jgi:hypothetical protein
VLVMLSAHNGSESCRVLAWVDAGVGEENGQIAVGMSVTGYGFDIIYLDIRQLTRC